MRIACLSVSLTVWLSACHSVYASRSKNQCHKNIQYDNGKAVDNEIQTKNGEHCERKRVCMTSIIFYSWILHTHKIELRLLLVKMKNRNNIMESKFCTKESFVNQPTKQPTKHKWKKNLKWLFAWAFYFPHFISTQFGGIYIYLFVCFEKWTIERLTMQFPAFGRCFFWGREGFHSFASLSKIYAFMMIFDIMFSFIATIHHYECFLLELHQNVLGCVHEIQHNNMTPHF